MNIFRLFKSSEKALEGTITVPDESLIKGSMALQITLLMEQYIQRNTEIAVTRVEDYSTLTIEYNKLCNLGLGNTKNAKIIKEQLDNFNASYQSRVKAEMLIEFIKDLRKHFDDSTLLISSEQFEKLCKKYKLVTGLLNDYTGIVPDKNIKEIQNVKDKIETFSGLLNRAGKGKHLWRITHCEDHTVSGEDEFETLVKWIKSKNNLVFASRNNYHYDNCLYLSDIKSENPDIPSSVKNYEYETLFKLQGNLITKRTMFIACPPEQLKEQSLKITKKAVDPIVFQYSPYGIVIHSIWGEEAEDKVFEEYKKVNQLLSL